MVTENAKRFAQQKENEVTELKEVQSNFPMIENARKSIKQFRV